jgi:membrane-bound metal-dependent hydrolase YbcI (DUF457 family)
VLIWFAAMSVVITFVVFQSPAIDYRFVALGSLVPLIEVPFGAGALHSLLMPTLVLAVVMLATRRRRLVRRRWLGLPIGMYLHVVLDLAWTRNEAFWWPLFGSGYSERALEVERGVWSLVMEAAGVVALVWAYRRFGLGDRQRRQRFLRTGQLDRSVMGPGAAPQC